MEELKYNYFYKVTNRVNGKVYFGIHSSDTEPQKDSYLGSGAAICRAVKKYGKENFIREEIEFFPTRHQLSLFESLWVTSIFVQQGDNYNLKPGGDPEVYQGGHPNPEIGHKISKAKKGKKRSDEVRETLRKAISGKYRGYHPDSGKCVLVDAKEWPEYEKQGYIRGAKSWSPELREKLETSRKGMRWIRRGNEYTKVPELKLQEYLKQGWELGRRTGLGVGRIGPMKGKHHSEESKQKKRETSRGMIWIHRGEERTMIHPESWEKYEIQGFEKGSGLPSPRKGVTLSEETKEKLRNRQVKPVSEETRKKLSEAHKGKKKGPMTEEHKKALSEAHRGYKRSLESIQKQVETRKRKRNGGAEL